MFFCYEIICASHTPNSLTYGLWIRMPFNESISKLLVFTHAIPDIKIFVNVKSCFSRFTMPALPLIEVMIVQPITKNFILCVVTQCNNAIVICMIVNLRQDCMFHFVKESRESVVCNQLYLQNNLCRDCYTTQRRVVICCLAKIHP